VKIRNGEIVLLLLFVLSFVVALSVYWFLLEQIATGFSNDGASINIGLTGPVDFKTDEKNWFIIYHPRFEGTFLFGVSMLIVLLPYMIFPRI
jgi:hypothetical protein